MTESPWSEYPSDWYVHGPNLANEKDHLWMFPNEEAAKHFAEEMAKDTRQTYIVLRKVGRVRAVIPVQWESAKETANG